MTLYELTDNINLQGNIKIVVFDDTGSEKETRYFKMVDSLDVYCYDIEDIEDLEVTYMYCEKEFGNTYMVIEVTEEE